MPHFVVAASSPTSSEGSPSLPSPLSSRNSEAEESSCSSHNREMMSVASSRKRPSHCDLASAASAPRMTPPNNGSSTRHAPWDYLPDYLVVSKRWARRRHPVVFVAVVFFAFWGCWTTTAMLQFPTAADSMSIWMEPPGGKAAAPLPTRDVASVQQQQAPAPAVPRSLGDTLIRGTATRVIPLPLPKGKVSVVLMNYSRPRMIRESTMMRTLLSHPNVDEVLLLHANPKTAFEFVHPKVKNVDAIEHNNEMGLSLRFYFCQTAENKWVLHLDDDMEFTTEALNELLIEYGRNPKRIVGRFGRDLTPGNSFRGYNSQSRHKSTEVVLTKLMLMERDTCSKFFEYAHLVWNDVVLHDGEGPLWNGEDIFMSLVANHVYGRPKDGSKFNNYAMDWLDVWQADDSLKDYDNGKYDISGGMRGIRFWDWRWWQTLLRRNRHYSYRGRLWQIARDRLRELDSLSSPSTLTS